jgi:hypothetical protein
LEYAVIAVATAALRDVEIAIEDPDAAPVVVLDVLLRRFVRTVGGDVSAELDRQRRAWRAQARADGGAGPGRLPLRSRWI